MLSAEEAESRSIHDIVMPLPGFDVIYPSHHSKMYRSEILVFSFQCVLVCVLIYTGWFPK